MELIKKYFTGNDRRLLEQYGPLPLMRQQVTILLAILKTVEQKHAPRTPFLGTTRTELHNGKIVITKLTRLSKKVSPKKRGTMTDKMLHDFRDYVIEFFDERLNHEIDYEHNLSEIESIRKTVNVILDRITTIELESSN